MGPVRNATRRTGSNRAPDSGNVMANAAIGMMFVVLSMAMVYGVVAGPSDIARDARTRFDCQTLARAYEMYRIQQPGSIAPWSTLSAADIAAGRTASDLRGFYDSGIIQVSGQLTTELEIAYVTATQTYSAFEEMSNTELLTATRQYCQWQIEQPRAASSAAPAGNPVTRSVL